MWNSVCKDKLSSRENQVGISLNRFISAMIPLFQVECISVFQTVVSRNTIHASLTFVARWHRQCLVVCTSTNIVMVQQTHVFRIVTMNDQNHTQGLCHSTIEAYSHTCVHYGRISCAIDPDGRGRTPHNGFTRKASIDPDGSTRHNGFTRKASIDPDGRGRTPHNGCTRKASRQRLPFWTLTAILFTPLCRKKSQIRRSVPPFYAKGVKTIHSCDISPQPVDLCCLLSPCSQTGAGAWHQMLNSIRLLRC